MNIVSLTIARGGSKGIKNKNLILINGNSLLSYQVKNCLSIKDIKSVYVSSDCKNILSCSKELGAIPVKRPDSLAKDETPAEDVLIHFANNFDFDIIVFAQTTSPLVESEDIQKGIDLFKTGEYDSVFSVTEEHWIPRWTEDLQPVNWNHFKRPRRQDMPTTLIENGAFYITSKSFLLKNKNRYGGKMGIVKIPLRKSFQIDTIEDVDLVKRLL